SAIQAALLRVPRVSPIVNDDGNKGTKLFLLNAPSLADLSQSVRGWAADSGYEIVPHSLHLGYDWFSADEVLSSLLPASLDPSSSSPDAAGTPTGYTTIGHIAHLNLRPEYVPYRHLIGSVILSKNSPQIRTVVNKLDSIDTEFRFFAMELLAGAEEYQVEQSESGCLFCFDFRKVYFNSRLHTEHARVWSQLDKGAVVADVMAGVGPFAIPAAKNRGCRVYANDLNPHCYEALITNAKRNRVEGGVHSSCEDGRAFIRSVTVRAFRREIGEEWQGGVSRTKMEKARRNGATPGITPTLLAPPSRLVQHFLMNLPATALEFLDAFRGLYTRLAEEVGREALQAEIESAGAEGQAGPWVHVHTFTKDMEDPARDILARANGALGLAEGSEGRLRIAEEGEGGARLHWVRKVAPNKDMYCLEFRVP
ncbi:hypothetical protein BDZ90DRAFT_207807, partial [Jaminaea rosea]